MGEIQFPAGTDVVITGDTHGLDHQLPEGTTGTVVSIAGREGKVRLVQWSTERVWGQVGANGARNVHVSDLAAVEPEPETEEIHVDHTGLLRPGDVVERVPDDRFGVIVRREKAPEPPKPEPGTFGTATVGDARIRGFVAGVGANTVFVGAKDGGYYTASGDAFPEDFTPDAPPALPTREALAEAFAKGKEAAFEAVEKASLWGEVAKAYYTRSANGLWSSRALEAARTELVKAARAAASTEEATP